MGKKQQLNLESRSAGRFLLSVTSKATAMPIFTNAFQRSIRLVKQMASKTVSFCSTWAIRVFPFTDNALPTPFFATRPTLAVSVRDQASIFGIIRMPLSTMSFQAILGSDTKPSMVVFPWGDRLDMSRINTSRYATKMVAV